jgi:hypothetical protein
MSACPRMQLLEENINFDLGFYNKNGKTHSCLIFSRVLKNSMKKHYAQIFEKSILKVPPIVILKIIKNFVPKVHFIQILSQNGKMHVLYNKFGTLVSFGSRRSIWSEFLNFES